jgi:NADH dehydrogenase
VILVTGAGGFTGSRIIARLVQEGEGPRALVRNPATAKVSLPEPSAEQVADMAIGDTTKPATLAPALEGVDTVIHTAFITAERKQGPGVNYYDTNVRGTRNLVEAAENAGVRRIVVLSGLGTRPAKPGSYMEGRYEAEQAVRESRLAWSILGPSVQFGRGAAFFTGLADLIKGIPLVVPMVGNGTLQFQPIWVEDTVTCLLKMAREPQIYDGRSIEVGGPDVFTYAHILDMLMTKLGKRRVKAPGPLPLVALGAGVMELALPKPPITRAALGLFAFPNRTDLDAVEKNFGFAPRSLPSWLAENDVG